MFSPTTDKPSVKVYGDTPTLYFSPLAMDKMQAYITLCNDEIGWLGRVDMVSPSMYYCDDVFLLHQEVHGATTEILPEGLVKFAEEYGGDTSNIRLWGHSHVNMGVSPSGQDNEQMALFKDNSMGWFFRVIGNKSGKIGITMFNYELGVEIDNIPWELDYDSGVDYEAIKVEIAEKVTRKVTTYTAPAYGKYGNGYQVVKNLSTYDYSDYEYGSAYTKKEPEKKETLQAYEDLIDSIDSVIDIYDIYSIRSGVDMSSSATVQTVMKKHAVSYLDIVDEVERWY